MDGGIYESSGNGKIAANPPEKSRRQLRRDRWVFWTIVSSALLVPVVIFVVPPVSDAYDETHRVAIECTVTVAEGGVASGGNRGGASWSRVQISTSDCGTLTLTRDITESNRDAVAADLSGGGRYSFQIGATTQATWKLYEVLGVTPMVYSFQQID
ncbi:hypothetical protein ABIE35_004104 [Paenarthrobacter sp. 4246]